MVLANFHNPTNYYLHTLTVDILLSILHEPMRETINVMTMTGTW